MSRKSKIAITSIIGFVFFVALVFIVTSLVMASVNDRSLVDEWKSWGTEVEEVFDDTQEDTTNETDDSTDDEQNDDSIEIVVDEEPEVVDVQNIADDYSNVVIVA